MNIVAPSFAVAGMVQFVSAFVLFCRFATQATELPALFGVDACTAPGDECRVARASRRFASVNAPAASLWISSLGLFLLAVPPHTRQVYRFWTGSLSSLFFFTSLAIVAVYFCTFEGPLWQMDYVILITIFAAYWIRDVDVVTGIAVYLFAYVWQLVAYLELYTVDGGGTPHTTNAGRASHSALRLCACTHLLLGGTADHQDEPRRCSAGHPCDHGHLDCGRAPPLVCRGTRDHHR